MDVGRSFTVAFDDPGWPAKVAVGSALALLYLAFAFLGSLSLGCTLLLALPVVAASWGYQARLARRVIGGEARPLPEWDDIGGLLREGALVLLIRLGYALPLVVVGGLAALFFGGVIASVGGGRAASANDALLPAVVLVAVLCGLAALAYAVAAAALFPAALGAYLVSGRLGAAFEVGRVWALARPHLGDLALVWLLTLVAASLQSMGWMAFCIGWPLVVFYTDVVVAHLWGQVVPRMVGAGGGQPSRRRRRRPEPRA